MNSDDLERLLIAHTDAWNDHDIERLMSLFADDCVFDASGDDYGISEWRLTGTLLDGSRVDVFGCDFLTVRDGKILQKNSFRKQRPPIREPR